MVDLYCERLGPGLWAEPLNTSSNLAFFVAGWAIWRLARVRQTLSPALWLLIVLVPAIGAGSVVFHTFATSWARSLDVAPILIFQVVFLWIYSRQVGGLGIAFTLALCAGFLLVAQFGSQFPDVLNGSLGYGPALVFLTGMGFYHYIESKNEPGLLLAASVVLFVSLVFRTIDNGICRYFTSGTHFVWHLLNSVVLFLLVRSVVVNLPRFRSPGSMAEAS